MAARKARARAEAPPDLEARISVIEKGLEVLARLERVAAEIDRRLRRIEELVNLSEAPTVPLGDPVLLPPTPGGVVLPTLGGTRLENGAGVKAPPREAETPEGREFQRQRHGLRAPRPTGTVLPTGAVIDEVTEPAADPKGDDRPE